MIYDLGDTASVDVTYVDPDTGLPADVAATLTVTRTDGTAGNPTVTRIDVGQYRASIPLDMIGPWSYGWAFAGASSTVDRGQLYIANYAPLSYTTLSKVRKALNFIDPNDTSDDTEILDAIESSSRSIEDWCFGRRFYLDPTPSTRLFVPVDWTSPILDVDDIGLSTGVTIAVGNAGGPYTPVTTGFRLGPLNAAARYEPYTYIEDITYSGLWISGGIAPEVAVTTRWGAPVTPAPIQNAALLQATRLTRRKASPEGVAGFSDMGVVRLVPLDPDVKLMIQKYRDYARSGA